MRYSFRPVALALALAALGCSGGGGSPTAGPPAGAGATAPPIEHFLESVDAGQGLVEDLAGGYTVTLEGLLSGSPTAEVTPWRSAQETDDLSTLAVDSFFKTGDFSVTGIDLGPSTVDVHYRVRHPFDAPINLAAPPNATDNRADLGYNGRVLLLADLPTGATVGDYSFFGGEAIANTDVLANPDGFYRPGGVLADRGTATNTFPYKLVVDEALGFDGNRTDRSGSPIANGGSPVGNYTPGIGGWQQANMGASRNGWTGYDFQHQGQMADNTFQVPSAYLASNSFEFDIAIIARYVQPKGGTTKPERQANRLPASPADTSKYVYRLPFAAVDCSVVTYRGETGGLLVGNTGSLTSVRAQIRDWDARAATSTFPDLGDDPDPSTVPAGEVGTPSVEVDIKDVTLTPQALALTDDDSPIGGDLTPESGYSDDPLYFRGDITNAAATGAQTAGTKRGLLRVIDAADSQNRSEYEFILDETLTPVTVNLPQLRTYQAISVDVTNGGPNDPPTATLQLELSSIMPGDTLTFQVTAENDPDGDEVYYDIDIDYGGTFTPDVNGLVVPTVPPTQDLHTTGGQPTLGSFTARVKVYDSANPAGTFIDLPYTVSSNPCAVATQSWDFDGDADGWLSGAAQNITNRDEDQYGFFQWGCHDLPGNLDAVTASAGGLTNQYLLTSSDMGECAFEDDYGINAIFNIVSPRLVVPPLCGATTVKLKFNAFMNAQIGSTASAYVSKDGGQTWGTALWTITGDETDQINNNVEVTVPGATAGQVVQVRFEFLDPSLGGWISATSYTGLYIDAVSLTADSAGSWNADPSPFVYEESFDGVLNWDSGAMSNDDVMEPCGLGFWGGGATCVQLYDNGPMRNFAALFGADNATCGEYQGDLGSTADYNIQSPIIDLSGVTGALTMSFDLVKSLNAGGFTLNMYISTNGGSSWGAPVFTATSNAPLATTRTGETADVSALAGSANARIRFQLTTTDPINPPPPDDPNYCDYSTPGDFPEAETDGTVYLSDPVAVDNIKIFQT